MEWFFQLPVDDCKNISLNMANAILNVHLLHLQQKHAFKLPFSAVVKPKGHANNIGSVGFLVVLIDK